jgi:ethanolamine permease
MAAPSTLKKTLGPFTLWGLGVGYVVSGEYFGWNLGLPEGGTVGMLLAIALVTVMYLGIVLAYAELAVQRPAAGGAHAYARAAFGPTGAALVGYAQAIAFLFSPPAIALAIGAYASQRYPELDARLPAAAAYVLFTLLNAWGVKQAAVFELWVTVFAVAELGLFAGLTLPHFSLERLELGPPPGGAAGVLHCLPFAIWFFLGIEGLANAAEEAHTPGRDLPRAFIASLATLLVLALLVFAGALGVAGPRGVVFAPGTAAPSDAPLPLALAHVVARDSLFYELLLGVGVLGLLASFHGILLAAGRATLELGRTGLLPPALAEVHGRSGTPRRALFLNMLIGLCAMLSGQTAGLITVAVLGALTTYGSSLIALLRSDRSDRSAGFRAPGHPWLSGLSLGLCGLSGLAICVDQPHAALGYAALLGVGALARARA